jgi:RNA recognition motif-containing protein
LQDVEKVFGKYGRITEVGVALSCLAGVVPLPPVHLGQYISSALSSNQCKDMMPHASALAGGDQTFSLPPCPATAALQVRIVRDAGGKSRGFGFVAFDNEDDVREVGSCMDVLLFNRTQSVHQPAGGSIHDRSMLRV